MKITWIGESGSKTDTVTGTFGDFYTTASGHSVSKSEVIGLDKRGGSTPGSGRKKNVDKGLPKRCQMYFYNTQEIKMDLEKSAAESGLSFSEYINKKLGL